MSGTCTWALVCSTSRARILRGLEPTCAPRPSELKLRARQENLRAFVTGRIGSGRTASLTPSAAQAWLRADERMFAAEIAALLETHRLAGEFSRLAVCSPPAMLALLREEFPVGLRRALVVELAADLLGAEGSVLLRRIAGLRDGARG